MVHLRFLGKTSVNKIKDYGIRYYYQSLIHSIYYIIKIEALLTLNHLPTY